MADRIVTLAIFSTMFIIMIGVIVGVFIMDPNVLSDLNETASDDNPHHYEVKIITDGSWEGSISSKDVKMEDISGTGDKKIDLGNSNADDIDIDLSKSDSSSNKLTVKLYSDGKVVDSDSTDMEDGQILISA